MNNQKLSLLSAINSPLIAQLLIALGCVIFAAGLAFKSLWPAGDLVHSIGVYYYWIGASIVAIGAVILLGLPLPQARPTEPTAAPAETSEPTGEYLSLAAPGVKNAIINGELSPAQGQILITPAGHYCAFIGVNAGKLRGIVADTPEAASQRYLSAVQRYQTETDTNNTTALPDKSSTPAQAENNGPDLDSSVYGYKPEQWMFKEHERIQKFITDKLIAKNVENMGGWNVVGPFANLNNVVYEIKTGQKAGIVYSQDFETELRGRIPGEAKFIRASTDRQYPTIVIPRRKRQYISTIEALNMFAQTHKQRSIAMLGYDAEMNLIGFDFAAIPHGLILGDTGGGKGVCTDNMIVSLLAKNTPNELQIVRCDPKGNEHSKFNGLPHMLGPVATAPEDILNTVQWVEAETRRRFDLLQAAGVSDFIVYNSQSPKSQRLPRIVLFFDEMKVFTNSAGKKIADQVATSLDNAYAMARAAGVNVVLITQTGVKNRMLNQVISAITSKIIFKCEAYILQGTTQGTSEMELLKGNKGLGHGFFYHESSLTEFQTPSTIIKDGERIKAEYLSRVIRGLKNKWGTAEPMPLCASDETHSNEVKKPEMSTVKLSSDDELYLDAVQFVIDQQAVVQSRIQKHLGIGGDRSKRLIAAMETDGFISKSAGRGVKRRVLITPDKLDKLTGEPPDNLRITPDNPPDNVVQFIR